jgi:hypothetical protein
MLAALGVRLIGSGSRTHYAEIAAPDPKRTIYRMSYAAP